MLKVLLLLSIIIYIIFELLTSENQRLFARGEGWGWREFVARDLLIDSCKSDLLTNDDKLTISCEVCFFLF